MNHTRHSGYAAPFGLIALWFLVLASASTPVASAEEESTRFGKIRSDLRAELDPGAEYVVWVYLRDKGPDFGRARIESLRSLDLPLSQRALARRSLRAKGTIVDRTDLPVFPSYVDAIGEHAGEVRTVSRWLNAVSVRATAEELLQLTRFEFVRRIEPVATEIRILPDPEPDFERGSPPPRTLELDSERSFPRTTIPFDYGPSASQVYIMLSDLLHNAGYDGSGVLICMLDTGFRTDHSALAHLNLIAERDFINWDAETGFEPGDPSGQFSHGTWTLGTVAGFEDGELVGPAFAADYALAKTERVDAEVPAEEDYWVAGLEWADSLGADVVSSSLGYFDWYTYDDMGGDSAVTSRAAGLAAAKGILVVTSAGNEGNMWGAGNGGLIAPGDADSVITVGAVDDLGTVAPWSSRGPTFDGRIKPEVCGMGVSTRTINEAGTTGYKRVSGTSLSTPLVAGACAQILQMRPAWTPMEVRDAIIQTATQASMPDNAYGYGIINAFAAAFVESTDIDPLPGPVTASLAQNEPNPFSPKKHGITSFRYALSYQDEVSLKIFDVQGRLVRTLAEGIYKFVDRPEGAFWDGTDGNGNLVASGVYFYRLQTSRQSLTKKLLLLE